MSIQQQPKRKFFLSYFLTVRNSVSQKSKSPAYPAPTTATHARGDTLPTTYCSSTDYATKLESNLLHDSVHLFATKLGSVVLLVGVIELVVLRVVLGDTDIMAFLHFHYFLSLFC